MRFLLPMAAILLLAGCGAEDTTQGAAESAAEMARKSANAPPLGAKEQAVIDGMKSPGGKK